MPIPLAPAPPKLGLRCAVRGLGRCPVAAQAAVGLVTFLHLVITEVKLLMYKSRQGPLGMRGQLQGKGPVVYTDGPNGTQDLGRLFFLGTSGRSSPVQPGGRANEQSQRSRAWGPQSAWERHCLAATLLVRSRVRMWGWGKGVVKLENPGDQQDLQFGFFVGLFCLVLIAYSSTGEIYLFKCCLEPEKV